MIAETMKPEASFKGGSVVGLSTLLGFLVATFFTTLHQSAGETSGNVRFESVFGYPPIPSLSGENGRVGMWRGGGRIGLSVSAPFVWRCLNSRVCHLSCVSGMTGGLWVSL